jgi:hypothetical protein
MKLTAKRQVEVVDEFEVDDRIHDEQCAAYKVADIIMGGTIGRTIERYIYSGDAGTVDAAVRKVNEAFAKADAVIALLSQTEGTAG